MGLWPWPKRQLIADAVLVALHRGVQRVDPRLVQACRYPQPYLPGVERSLAYVEALVAEIPGPLTVNREAFLHQPLVRALFAAPDEVASALCRSPEARAYAEGHGGSCHAMCALMTAEYAVHNDFGPGEVGGILVRDLPRQTWNFHHHALLCPGETETAVRAALVIRLMDGLFDVVAERLAQQRVEGQACSAAQETGKPAETRCVTDLCGQIEDFNAVLCAPEDYLSLQSQSVSMDALGTIDGSAASAGAARVALLELRQYAHPPRVVALVQCQGDGQPPSLARGLQDVQHWLH